MFIENENQGLIFPNDNATSDKAPDFTGAINVDGEQKQIALWWKEFEKGGEGFSVKISEPYEASGGGQRGGGRSSGRSTQRPAAARPAASQDKLTPRPKPTRR